jgi:hypothetical protein
MSSKTFGPETLKEIRKLVASNKETFPIDWFAIGFLYAHPNNAKNISQIFQNVNNIT